MVDIVGPHNYFIGKGVVSFKKTGDADFRDMGNATEVSFTPTIEQLDHFSSRAGVRVKDRTVVIEKSGTVNLVLEEWMVENLALALLGDVEENTEGLSVIDIFASAAVEGELKILGTNEVGPKWDYHFLKVSFIPGESLGLITDEWGPINLNGEVAAVEVSTGVFQFGTATRTAQEADAPEGTETV